MKFHCGFQFSLNLDSVQAASESSDKFSEMITEPKFLQKAPNPDPLLNPKSTFAVPNIKNRKRHSDGVGSFIVTTSISHNTPENKTINKIRQASYDSTKFTKDFENKKLSSSIFADHDLAKIHQFKLKPESPIVLTTESCEQALSHKATLVRNFRITASTGTSVKPKEANGKNASVASSLLNSASTSRIELHRHVLIEPSMDKEDAFKVPPVEQQQTGQFMNNRLISEVACKTLKHNSVDITSSRSLNSTKIDFRLTKNVHSSNIQPSTFGMDLLSNRGKFEDSKENDKKTVNSLKDLNTLRQSRRGSLENCQKPSHQCVQSLSDLSSANELSQSGTPHIVKDFLKSVHLQGHQAQDTSLVIAEEPESPEIIQHKADNVKPTLRFTIPGYQPAKCSTVGNGAVKAYAVATNPGTSRKYNEDRVSVLINIPPPKERAHENWPSCSFFAVYDGHGGKNCADYLRDHLHEFVLSHPSFPVDPSEALKKGFEKAEKEFLALIQQSSVESIDHSGSCALVTLIIGEICYVANVGDSRAVLSFEEGEKVYAFSRDHKPLDDDEYSRIITAGGRIYQSQRPAGKIGIAEEEALSEGPYRIWPGKLAVNQKLFNRLHIAKFFKVSRSFGDIKSKLPEYGGNPNCVIAIPEIKIFKLTQDCDFIVLGSDGIFDAITNRELVDTVWNSLNKYQLADDLHKQTGFGVDIILQKAINQGTVDNVTAVMIALGNFERKFSEKSHNHISNREENQILMDRSHKDERLNTERIMEARKPLLLALHKSPIDTDFSKKDENTTQTLALPSKKIIDCIDIKSKPENSTKPLLSLEKIAVENSQENKMEQARLPQRRITRKTLDVDLKSSKTATRETFKVVSKPKSLNYIH